MVESVSVAEKSPWAVISVLENGGRGRGRGGGCAKRRDVEPADLKEQRRYKWHKMPSS